MLDVDNIVVGLDVDLVVVGLGRNVDAVVHHVVTGVTAAEVAVVTVIVGQLDQNPLLSSWAKGGHSWP